MKTIRSKQQKPPALGRESGRIRVSDPHIRHLLVPLDFSGKSRQALKYAVPLARQFQARISLVHVVEPVYAYPATEPVGHVVRIDVGDQTRVALRRLKLMAAQYVPPDLWGHNLTCVGSPARIIVELIPRHHVDLVVLSTNGRSGLTRLLLGSTAEYVVRHATCPVLTVRRQ